VSLSPCGPPHPRFSVPNPCHDAVRLFAIPADLSLRESARKEQWGPRQEAPKPCLPSLAQALQSRCSLEPSGTPHTTMVKARSKSPFHPTEVMVYVHPTLVSTSGLTIFFSRALPAVANSWPLRPGSESCAFGWLKKFYLIVTRLVRRL